MGNNRPTHYERIAVQIGKKNKIALINYCMENRKSVSDVVRKLVAMCLDGKVTLD